MAARNSLAQSTSATIFSEACVSAEITITEAAIGLIATEAATATAAGSVVSTATLTAATKGGMTLLTKLIICGAVLCTVGVGAAVLLLTNSNEPEEVQNYIPAITLEINEVDEPIQIQNATPTEEEFKPDEEEITEEEKEEEPEPPSLQTESDWENIFREFYFNHPISWSDDDYGVGFSKLDGYIFDIDGDGIPELLIASNVVDLSGGHFYIWESHDIYQLQNGEPVNIGNVGVIRTIDGMLVTSFEEYYDIDGGFVIVSIENGEIVFQEPPVRIMYDQLTLLTPAFSHSH
jgi:hypothetical protein